MSGPAIRIGTLVRSEDGAEYIRRILPHGFESFSIVFQRSAVGRDLERLSGDVNDALAESDAVVSSLGIYGNALMGDGSVHLISEDIHQPTWAALCSRAKGDIVGDF